MKSHLWKAIALVSGPALGAVAFAATRHLAPAEDAAPLAIAWTALVTVWSAVWWVTEVIPIPATSLLPIAILPTVGVLEPDDVGKAYGSSLVLLMMGGFMLSTAMQRSGVHRRLAIMMIRGVGGEDSRRLILGFMAASAVLSMWISNAATVLMLLPIALAAIEDVRDSRVRTRVLLGIAYAASVGGTATPIGTPPNLVYLENVRMQFGDEPSFLEWMQTALPVTLAMLPVTGLWLTRGIRDSRRFKFPELGAWRPEERRTLAVFGVTALLWMSRKGWSQLAWGPVSLAGANDASVALLAVVAMFLIPRGRGSAAAAAHAEPGGPTEADGGDGGDGGKNPNDADAAPASAWDALLDWKSAADIQWGVLLLFSGGLVIAAAFGKSGLSMVLGEQLSGITVLPVVPMVAIIALAVTFLTEITSNTATTTLLMPILAAAAVSAEVEPQLLMVPATLSASFAFMLPVATPTNAIVFGGSELSVKDMAREGLVLNLIGAMIVTARCCFLG